MQKETYDAIKLKWGTISTREQRSLIYQYIQGDRTGLRGSWMEFLQQQFGLPHSYAGANRHRSKIPKSAPSDSPSVEKK